MVKPGRSARRLASPYVRSAVAVLLLGGVVVTVLPRVAEVLSWPIVILLTVAAVAVTLTLSVRRRVRLYRANRLRLLVDADEWWEAVTEINTLEQLHALPAYEPNRSAYPRKGA